MNKTLNKILVVLYGVIGRSIKYTYLNHKEKIFKKLKKENISFDVCVVNNNIQTTKIDGYLINNDDYKMVDYDFYIEETQKIIDKKINKFHSNYESYFGNNFYDYIEKYKKDPLRNSYIETITSDYIRLNESKYDKVIAFCSDLFFAEEIDIKWIQNEECNLIHSNQHNANGITNGFYIGTPRQVSDIMNSFYDLKSLAQIDYEHILSLNSEKKEIQTKGVDFRFLKIRATGEHFKLHCNVKRKLRLLSNTYNNLRKKIK